MAFEFSALWISKPMAARLGSDGHGAQRKAHGAESRQLLSPHGQSGICPHNLRIKPIAVVVFADGFGEMKCHCSWTTVSVCGYPYSGGLIGKVLPSFTRGLRKVAEQGYNSYMKQATISDLKNQLSRFIDYVRQGETVLVLDRKVPVAELRPLSDKVSAGKLTSLERKGILRRGKGRLPKDFLTRPLGGKKGRVLDALLEERAEGQ